MNEKIKKIFKGFEERGLKRDRVFEEILRVLTLKQILVDNRMLYNTLKKGKAALFKEMKSHTDGRFPGDKDYFFDIFEDVKDIDILNLIHFYITYEKSNRKIRRGDYYSLFSNISSYFADKFKKYNPKTVLVLEPEKFIAELGDIIESFPKIKFILFTGDNNLKKAFQLQFARDKNIEVKYIDFLSEKIVFPKVQYVISMNIIYTFRNGSWHIVSRSEELWRKILNGLKKSSTLFFLMDSLSNTGSKHIEFQKELIENYSVKTINNVILGKNIDHLPRTISIIEICKSEPSEDYNIEIKEIESVRNEFELKNTIVLKKSKLIDLPKWDYNYMVKYTCSDYEYYKSKSVEKVKLHNIADIQRSIFSTKKINYKAKGSQYIMNMDSIQDGKIDLDGLRRANIEFKTKEPEMFYIKEGDLVVTCRGTLIKFAIVPKINKNIIATSNLIYIRPNKHYDSRYIKLFLESKIGRLILESITPQGIMLAINSKNLGDIEIPDIPYNKQITLIEKYNKGKDKYEKTISKAENAYMKLTDNIYKEMLG
jgi:hypothetical protein